MRFTNLLLLAGQNNDGEAPAAGGEPTAGTPANAANDATQLGEQSKEFSLEAFFENPWDFIDAEKVGAVAANVVFAIVILVVGFIVARIITGIVKKAMVRSKVDETLVQFLGALVLNALKVLVILAAVNRLGVNTTSFAAIIAACGLAVAMALQGTLSNFAAGVMLILFKPFKVGDFVDAGGTTGTVEGIQIFNTMFKTGDNVSIMVPNSQITSGTITNFSAKDTRRIDLVIGCGYGDDLRAVRSYLEEVVRSDDRILQDPEPVVAVSELGDSSVNFVVRPWVESGDYWGVRWDLTEKIKLGFDERGFNFPYPSTDVYTHAVSSD